MSRRLADSAGPDAPRPTIAFQSKTVLVYDDFLPTRIFDEIFAYCNSANYVSVHQDGWTKVWRLHDGEPLRGQTWYYAAGEASPDKERFSYPTGTALDRFIEAIQSRFSDIAPIVGAAGEDWNLFSVCPWVYRAGSALSLHQDGEVYSGSYVYYTHRHWKIHWGGHLIVLDPKADEAKPRATGKKPAAVHPPWLDDALDIPHTWATGIATCFFPKPNRLVLLSSQVPHLVTRVDQSAGDNPRVTLAGFFVKPDE
jgi:2-oxoglutarate-Fe(II)-dependent oxygenase superfamily protein